MEETHMVTCELLPLNMCLVFLNRKFVDYKMSAGLVSTLWIFLKKFVLILPFSYIQMNLVMQMWMWKYAESNHIFDMSHIKYTKIITFHNILLIILKLNHMCMNVEIIYISTAIMLWHLQHCSLNKICIIFYKVFSLKASLFQVN